MARSRLCRLPDSRALLCAWHGALTPPASAARAALPARSWHMFDATIVIISFTLELSLRGVAQEVASLLIFFRWVGPTRHLGWQSTALQLLLPGCWQWGAAPELQPRPAGSVRCPPDPAARAACGAS